MDITKTKLCRSCGGNELQQTADLGAIPIAHRFLTNDTDPEEVYRFQVSTCLSCGLTQHLDPIDPEILYRSYNHNFSSWKNEPHIDDEVARIMAHSPRRAIEIGANDGRFLSKLRAEGVDLTVGIEPNPVSGQQATEKGHVIYPSMLSKEVVREIVDEHGTFDLVVTRQVLEHLIDLEGFFHCVRHLLGPDGMAFIDVPDFRPYLEHGDCSAFWEEHVNYFTAPVLSDLFARHGFEVFDSHWYDFSGGTIAVLAGVSNATNGADDAEAVRQYAQMSSAFQPKMAEYGGRLLGALSAAKSQGATVVIYGVGCRANTVVNGFGLKEAIDFAVDDQPERQGLRMAGSRLVIFPSQHLERVSGPVLCLLAVNNESEPVVKSNLGQLSKADISCFSVLGPTDIWNELGKLEDNVRSLT